nr:galectin-4 [Parasteatoda tepidariorum]
MTLEVLKPGVPYLGCIPKGLQDGTIVEIKGTVPYNRERFEINFLAGMDTSNADRPLHISVRFDENVAVRNTLVRSSWQTEEREGKFPFCQGQSFLMLIIVKSHCYTINVNNQHCWDFVHRIPYYTVTALHIKGSVSIEQIRSVGNCGSSSLTCETAFFNHFYPAYPEPVCPDLSTNFPAVYNPSIPYAYPLCGGLRPGMMIYISGKPTTNPNKFTINLQAGTSPYAPPDVAFHFDVRFFNQSIVRNTRTNNAWHDEETLSASFPFNSICHFDMIIRVTENKYMVAVNGQHFIEFRHRLWPLSRFDTLYIANDISVQSIRFA